MKITPTAITDCLVIEPKLFVDERGFFYESFNQRLFNQSTGLAVTFVQDNHSKSVKGVLRGLHYQLPPTSQGKLVRAVRGRVLDVAVDLRKSSATFGEWIAVELTHENCKQLWLPPGLAHGFCVLSEEAEILYKTTDFYSSKDERCIAWNDPALEIDWQLGNTMPLLSAKDQGGLLLADAEVFD